MLARSTVEQTLKLTEKLRARCGSALAPRRPSSARTLSILRCRTLKWAVRPELGVVRAQMSTDSGDKAPVSPDKLLMREDIQSRVRSVIADSTAESGWDQLWKEGATPWDMGGVTPVIQDLVDKGKLPHGRALVPGCGSGYDVLALASENRRAIGIDLSTTVNKAAKKNAANDPRGQWVEFLVVDFFDYKPDAPFTLVFDYTFFCAIDPSLRQAWGAKMAELLTEEGELLTLIFPLGDFEGGPPFAVSVEAYERVLHPHGFTMTSCEDNEMAVGPRKGREKIAHWTRKTGSSKF